MPVERAWVAVAAMVRLRAAVRAPVGVAGARTRRRRCQPGSCVPRHRRLCRRAVLPAGVHQQPRRVRVQLLRRLPAQRRRLRV